MAESDTKSDPEAGLICPSPITRHDLVLLAHGGGGRMTNQLLEQLVLPAFRNELLDQRHDGAVFEIGGVRLAMTTDSYVVRPLVFPGGDIGSLAVNGTVNDLAMCGARPLYLSLGMIIEEGLPMATLEQIVGSVRRAAELAGVTLVTGDTKVVERGKADGLFINTTGIGVIEGTLAIAPDQVRPGDRILVSGDLGRHGIAIMATREGLSFESMIESDTASLVTVVRSLIGAGVRIHCLRDLTRGGLASALVEIAEASGSLINLDESAIPVREDVRGACEILGLDPLHLASEGRLVAFVPAADASTTLDLLRQAPGGDAAAMIGEVLGSAPGRVTMRTPLGTSRIVDMLSGEQLPRIC
ncbi:MAG: hydrogenase expression/formation protein HypE [Acidobacteriota bacterium]|jgi:hydrogenase expression/formation protein HypE